MWLSPNEVCIGVAVSVKNICAGFITVSVKKLLHYRAGGLLQYRAVLLHYRAVITLSGVFYYIIGRFYYIIEHVLQYRAFITLSVGTSYFNVSHRRCMPRTLAWRRAGLGHACQYGDIVDFDHYFSCLKFRFCLSTMSTIMIIL